MTITHHPDVATLLCCSAGSQPEACAAVIASHLACCPECRAEVRKMQRIGEALFDTLEPSTMSQSAPIVALRAGEAEARPAEAGVRVPCARCTGDVPPPLARLIGERLDEVPWRWIAPGIWTYRVPLSEGCCGDLRLFRIAPGRALPEHAHDGWELTLVLRGSYTDELGTFRQGDVADLDEGTEHRPVACPEQGCICLTATEKKLRFKSWLPRLLQPVLGL